MRAGTLASIRIDSCRRVPLEDLNALIARLRGAGGTYDGESAGSDGVNEDGTA